MRPEILKYHVPTPRELRYSHNKMRVSLGGLSLECGMKLQLTLLATVLWGVSVLPASAEDKDTRLAAGVQDNLCLVEEAYNQEPGVVQHISCLRGQGRDLFFNFTQEWPLGSQAHQFSYSVPYSWLRSEGRRVQGVGDIPLAPEELALRRC